MMTTIGKNVKDKKSRRGFTLMEMLIVVVIIGVLAAIAIPVFSNQIERARERTDEANVKSAASLAVTDYMVERRAGSAKYYFADDVSSIAIAYIEVTTDEGTVTEVGKTSGGIMYAVADLIEGQSSDHKESTIIIVVENNAVISTEWGDPPSSFIQ